MSEGLNRVTLMGQLGADPEYRVTQSGSGVLNIRLATNESYLDKDKVRRERTDWHTVVVFGGRGEGLAKILAKGMTIVVEGRLQTSSYEKDGEKRYKTEVVANNVVLPPRGSGEHGAAGSTGGGSQGGGHGGNTPPQRQGGQQARPQQGRQGGGGYGDNRRQTGPALPQDAPDDGGGYGGNMDDIPFASCDAAHEQPWAQYKPRRYGMI